MIAITLYVLGAALFIRLIELTDKGSLTSFPLWAKILGVILWPFLAVGIGIVDLIEFLKGDK